MSGFWATIISAVILGPLVALIHNLKKQNHDEHMQTSDKIDAISDKLDEIGARLHDHGERLHGHIEWHLDGIQVAREDDDNG